MLDVMKNMKSFVRVHSITLHTFVYICDYVKEKKKKTTLYCQRIAPILEALFVCGKKATVIVLFDGQTSLLHAKAVSSLKTRLLD